MGQVAAGAGQIAVGAAQITG
ncbi:MAG: hypothetical protein KF760_04850 [Candidatus Eremiobacteraeota bacterium]|nr:hypothetical protein [Candidatus Eremiobacteraeota bacterium]